MATKKPVHDIFPVSLYVTACEGKGKHVTVVHASTTLAGSLDISMDGADIAIYKLERVGTLKQTLEIKP